MGGCPTMESFVPLGDSFRYFCVLDIVYIIENKTKLCTVLEL
jgi:hypothetical protein